MTGDIADYMIIKFHDIIRRYDNLLMGYFELKSFKANSLKILLANIIIRYWTLFQRLWYIFNIKNSQT